jgi:hypothetical protein
MLVSVSVMNFAAQNMSTVQLVALLVTLIVHLAGTHYACKPRCIRLSTPCDAHGCVLLSCCQVMGYSSRGDVSAESLKAKRRQLVLAVHPDKVGGGGCKGDHVGLWGHGMRTHAGRHHGACMVGVTCAGSF